MTDEWEWRVVPDTTEHWSTRVEPVSGLGWKADAWKARGLWFWSVTPDAAWDGGSGAATTLDEAKQRCHEAMVAELRYRRSKHRLDGERLEELWSKIGGDYA